MPGQRAQATRTTNPLHFEDLEPHRFEDLVRQLVYGTCEWSALEALGRAGADEGVDIRGVEARMQREVLESEGDDEENRLEAGQGRVWLVQCKREQQIGPAKATRYAKETVPEGAPVPDVLVLAAACDFSLAARRAFREEALALGVSEVHLWGKAELEDMLFSPRNDHLLFAYFNISLGVRRRTVRTEKRALLTIKRQLLKAVDREIGDDWHQDVFLRDATDDRYGRADPYDLWPAWRWFTSMGSIHPDVLFLRGADHPAWLSSDGRRYDYAVSIDHAETAGNRSRSNNGYPPELRRFHHWEGANLPSTERANFVRIAILPYERIVLVDDIGDAWNDPPHILVDGPLDQVLLVGPEVIEKYGGVQSRITRTDDLVRESFFPDEFPEVQFVDIPGLPEDDS